MWGWECRLQSGVRLVEPAWLWYSDTVRNRKETESGLVLDWKVLKLDVPRSSSSVKLFKAAPCLPHLVRLVTLTPAPNDFSNWKSASPNDLSKCPTQNLHLYLPSLACWPWITPKWLDQILRLLKNLSKILVKMEKWNEMSNYIDSAGCRQTF